MANINLSINITRVSVYSTSRWQPVFYMDMKEKVLRGGLIVISIFGLICLADAYCMYIKFLLLYASTTAISMVYSIVLLRFSLRAGLTPSPPRVRVSVIVGDVTLTCLYIVAGVGLFFRDTECLFDDPNTGRVAVGVFGLLGGTVSGILGIFGVMDVRKRREEESRPIMQVPPHS